MKQQNYNSKESQEAMSILLASKRPSPLPNLKLVSALSRGGLWEITDVVQKLFVIVEKYFCIQTGKSSLRNINTSVMTNVLMAFGHIQDFYNLIVSSADIKPSKFQKIPYFL